MTDNVELSNYTLGWRWDGSEGIRWDIMGIFPTGDFVGDIMLQSTDPAKCAGAGVRGTIPPDRWRRGKEILASFENAPPIAPPKPRSCFGALFRWTEEIGTGDLVLCYKVGDEGHSKEAQLFLEVKEILDPQVSEAYVYFDHLRK